MKTRTVNGRWEVVLPDHIADHPFLDCHEPERFESMAWWLTPGAVLFDIGAEHGCCSAVYAQMVDSIVLFEPTPAFWRNIRLTWEANGLRDPLGCWPGFLTDTTPGPPRVLNGWPHCAAGNDEAPPGPYRHLATDVDVPSTTVDAWVKASRIAPDAMTIDVEGAEWHVLSGASWTIANHRPDIWLSVHTDEMLASHGAQRDWVFSLLHGHGYSTELLATDHEEHWLCLP